MRNSSAFVVVGLVLIACGSERPLDGEPDSGGDAGGGTGTGDAASGEGDASSSRDAGESKDGATADSGGKDGGSGATILNRFGVGTAVCAVSVAGAVKCWGYNGYAALGLGDTNNRGDDPNEMGQSLSYVALGQGRTARQVVTGSTHSCALLDNAQVKCWGHSDINGGQTGLGEYDRRGDQPGEMGDALPYVNLGTGRTALQLSAGGMHVCAILDDKSLKCWGSNSYGQLGLGNTAARGDAPGEMGDALPTVQLGTGRTVLQVAAGGLSTCVLLDDETMKCWGENGYGQLGRGNVQHRGQSPGEMGDALAAISLGTGRKAVQIGAGNRHTCARLDDGSVKCWGYNLNGILGLGDTNNRGDAPGEMGDALQPVSLGTGRKAVDLRVGFSHSCALLDNGALKCWGYNSQGVLGQGDEQDRGSAPGQMGDALSAVDLGTGRRAMEIGVGYNNTCALLDNTTIKCWGSGNSGALGQGDKTTRGNGPNQMGDNLPVVPVF